MIVKAIDRCPAASLTRTVGSSTAWNFCSPAGKSAMLNIDKKKYDNEIKKYFS
jgi:hypothetical protein